MHHLECRFDHALLREQFAKVGINTLKPFSDFPFFRQAFAEGERWPVRRERAERLRKTGLITEGSVRPVHERRRYRQPPRKLAAQRRFQRF